MSETETPSGGFSVKRLLPVAVSSQALSRSSRSISTGSSRSMRSRPTARFSRNGSTRKGALAWLVYAAIYMVAVAFSIPGGAVLTIAGGFMFGPFVATAVVVVGATCGATLLFLAARYAFADYLRGKAGGAMRRMEAGFNENPVSYMLVLRLVPLFPFWLVNLVPAFLGVKLRTYFLSTLVGIIPGTFVYALVGDGAGAVLDAGGDLDLGIIFEPRFLAPIIGLAVLACIPILYKRIQARRSARQ